MRISDNHYYHPFHVFYFKFDGSGGLVSRIPEPLSSGHGSSILRDPIKRGGTVIPLFVIITDKQPWNMIAPFILGAMCILWLDQDSYVCFNLIIVKNELTTDKLCTFKCMDYFTGGCTPLWCVFLYIVQSTWIQIYRCCQTESESFSESHSL